MRSNDRASHGPRARRLGTSIPAAGCKCQANAAPGLLSPQPTGLKSFVDFCLAVSRRSRPSDCFAGYDAAPAARRCGVARSGETAAGIAQRSRLQKSANALQRPSWDLLNASLRGIIVGWIRYLPVPFMRSSQDSACSLIPRGDSMPRPSDHH
jgi:hypothetical protein